MLPPNSIILVTGVSGYAGSHVVDQLLNEGYRVRGTVRPGKLERTQKAFDDAYGHKRVDVIAIEDIITSDFSSAFEGVQGLIHVASPLPGSCASEAMLDGAIGGTVNIIQQAQKAGIKQISVQSGLSANLRMDQPKTKLTEEDWNHSTREEALERPDDTVFAYLTSKALAEKEVWKLAEKHPDLNITTLNPPAFIGPYAPGMVISPGDVFGLGSNLFIYNILWPNGRPTDLGIGFIDIRDVAKSHVLALNAHGRNRILLTGESFQLKDAIDYIVTVRPELKARLPILKPAGQSGLVDNTRALEILGLKSVKSWKDSVLDTVDALIAIEKDWTERGIDVEDLMEKCNPFNKKS